MIYNMTDDIFVSTGALLGRNPVKLRQYDNRIWAVCDDGALVFSNNGDASTWDANNIILLPNREPMIDFLPVQGGVILTHRGGAYALYGSGTYQDTSILPIQDSAAPGSKLMLSDSAVVVDNVAYVLGNRGVHAVSLNGIKEIPHDQTAYFSERYGAWNTLSVAVQGVYLYRFHSILYLFQEGYGAEGFLYNIRTGAFHKIGHTLPAALPYMMDIHDSSVDFLFGCGDGTTIGRSVYPAGVLAAQRLSTIQTRHEDVDSNREKVWRHLGIEVERDTPNVLIQAFLDHSEIPTILKYGVVDLVKGDNIIDLFDWNDRELRSKTISIRIDIGGNVYLVADGSKEVLMNGNEPLISEDPPTTAANFAIREIRLKYREVGAAK